MFGMPQKVTFWTPTANNGTGGKTWSTPVTIGARIADIAKLVFTINGKERHATRAIYSKSPIPVDSYVVEGDVSDLTPTTAAQLVISATNNTSITNMNKALV